MKNINGQRFGTTINISIDGKLIRKTCETVEQAKELFDQLLKTKSNQTDENLKKLFCYLNEKRRVALEAGLEADEETGEIYLAGFNTPIPMTLVGVIKNYNQNNYPIDAIINFWKLLMINPDKRVRTTLFDFITNHDFVLTDKGYMIVYKAVYKKEIEEDNDTKLVEFVSNRYFHVKKTWKESPKNYVVYQKLSDKLFYITKEETFKKCSDFSQYNVVGNLDEVFNDIFNSDNKVGTESTPYYTDMFSKTMTIELGKPVQKLREECDGDPEVECSYGLHVGATKYVNNYANSKSVILACLVNPANVVAVPKHDCSKMRVTEYFPFAVATYENGKIDIVEQQYFEEDYCDFEFAELETMVAKVLADELPIEKALKGIEEDRPMSELLKIIESRLVDVL